MSTNESSAADNVVEEDAELHQAVEDLLAVAHIPDDRVEATASALEGESGFVDIGRLTQLVRSHNPDEKQAEAVVRLVSYWVPDSVPGVLQWLDTWRSSSPENSRLLTDKEFGDVQAKLPRLIRNFPAIQRYRKASYLKAATGSIAQGVQLICDLRPVFDERREAMEGLIPVLLLKLSYIQQDGESKVLELNLPQQVFTAFLKEAEKAHQKLNVIEATASNWTPYGLVDPN